MMRKVSLTIFRQAFNTGLAAERRPSWSRRWVFSSGNNMHCWMESASRTRKTTRTRLWYHFRTSQQRRFLVQWTRCRWTQPIKSRNTIIRSWKSSNQSRNHKRRQQFHSKKHHKHPSTLPTTATMILISLWSMSSKKTTSQTSRKLFCLNDLSTFRI